MNLTPSPDPSCGFVGFVTVESKNGSFHMPDSLVVMQVKESHALALPSDTLPMSGLYTLVVPPYDGMGVGDSVTFSWQGVLSDGTRDDGDAISQAKILAVSDVDAVLAWSLPSEYVSFIAEGTAQFSYSVNYADGSVGTVDAPLQTIDIDGPAWVSERLPLVIIENHIGTSIDPEDYPAGLTIYVAQYPGIEPDDCIILYATGGAGLVDDFQALRVTQQLIDGDTLSFNLSNNWLRDHMNDQLSIMYQYSRQGGSRSSKTLLLSVQAMMKNDAPIIQGATPDDTQPNRGFIEAKTLARGVSVSISPNVAVGANIKVEVYWEGFGVSGSHTANEPKNSSDLRTFEIPASAVPANMKKAVSVSYRVTSLDQSVVFSKSYTLDIKPVPTASFQTIACTQASDGNLSVSKWVQGADFVLRRWLFMAEGQIINCTASGGGATAEIFKDYFVTSQHVLDGKVEGKLSYEFLSRLIPGGRLYIEVSVSFDSGESELDFPSVPLVLVA